MPVIEAVAAGSYHAAALLQNGSLVSWGNNAYGQLGDGTTASRHSPVQIKGLHGKVTAISTGAYHTVALLKDASLVVWGYNNEGQLGDGTYTTRKHPFVIPDLKGKVTAISTGFYHTVVLLKDGSVKTFGSNIYGQLGHKTTTPRHFPIEIESLHGKVASISAGAWHTVVLLTDGSVMSIGDNQYGQLGIGTTTNRNFPTEIKDLHGKVASISAGVYYTVALLKDGSIMTWGDNSHGQLGDGTTIDRSRPVAVKGLKGKVVSISVGSLHTVALLENGSLIAFGENDHGQLGVGTTTFRTSPTQVLLKETELFKTALFNAKGGRALGLLELEKREREITGHGIGL